MFLARSGAEQQQQRSCCCCEVTYSQPPPSRRRRNIQEGGRRLKPAWKAIVACTAPPLPPLQAEEGSRSEQQAAPLSRNPAGSAIVGSKLPPPVGEASLPPHPHPIVTAAKLRFLHWWFSPA